MRYLVVLFVFASAAAFPIWIQEATTTAHPPLSLKLNFSAPPQSSIQTTSQIMCRDDSTFNLIVQVLSIMFFASISGGLIVFGCKWRKWTIKIAAYRAENNDLTIAMQELITNFADFTNEQELKHSIRNTQFKLMNTFIGRR
jgi:hypothetical protein